MASAPAGHVLPESPRLRRRVVRHHAPLAALTSAGLVLILLADPSKQAVHRWSMATAYTGLALIAATLTIGPLNLLRWRPNAVSTDLRRDIGIWAGMVSIAHFLVGWQVHMKHRWLYFLRETHAGSLTPRTDLFGFANDTGLIATLTIALLLILSNDWSFRRLGAVPWKRLQRWNYAVAALVVAHTVAYQVIEKRRVLFVLLAVVIILVALAFQSLGVRRVRARAG